MKNENFILLTEVSDNSSKNDNHDIIINIDNISTIYENQFNNCVIVMNHMDFEYEKDSDKKQPKRIVVKEDFSEIIKMLGFIK